MDPSEIRAALDRLNADEVARLSQEVQSSPFRLWAPNKGPQAQAYASQADELFYGGGAGGGKSALIKGLALTQHERSLIIRRESTQLRGLIDEIARDLGTRSGFNAQMGIWRLPEEVAI